LIVLGIWCVQLLFSRAWLARFRFGPVEWCWRSLTYAQRQPMRLALHQAGAMTETAEVPPDVTAGAVTRP